ncbi:MAG TPA: hypothetical protein PKH16_14005 [Aequorivita sp.]|nr:hypothetical protein [Aequorivita sp.]
METYIAFFDILGFKQIVYNNDFKELSRLFDHLLRDSQTAVSGENFIQMDTGGIVPDLTNQKVNCLHVSDSIIFWTNKATEDDFKELVNVCYSFYWRSLQTTFPLRGCLTFGEMELRPITIKSGTGDFHSYSVIGKGIVDAYLKAESIEYAGCILASKAIEQVDDKLINDLIQEQKICMYKVPFKNGINYEHVFRPIKGNHNDVSFRNTANGIKRLFTSASKMEFDKLPECVLTKLNNTIEFANYFRETDTTE